MRVTVDINVLTNLKSEVGQAVEFMVKEGDSVSSLKTKIMESQLIGFPDQKLMLNKTILDEAHSLKECGVQDGCGVELTVQRSEADLLKSLVELVSGQEIALEELALLYCYKHGISINQELQAIGLSERFSAFISRHDQFQIKSGIVTLMGEVVKSQMTHRPPPGLERPKLILNSRNAVKNERSDEKNDAYLELHSRISGRAFSSKVTQALNEISATISEHLPFNIERVIRGGSVGRGTVIGNFTDAELVFHIRDMPATAHLKPELHKAVVGVLKMQLGAPEVEDIVATNDAVKFTLRGMLAVTLKFVPVFSCFADVHKAMATATSEARERLAAALTKERTHFISKQSGQVKVTMRLMKWWRDQQKWTNAIARPSNDLLELLTVYSAIQSKPKDQNEAVNNVFKLMANFHDLNVTWTNFYKKSEVWAPLSQNRPLVMDPVNPYLNIADPKIFQSREMMMLANKTQSLIC